MSGAADIANVTAFSLDAVTAVETADSISLMRKSAPDDVAAIDALASNGRMRRTDAEVVMAVDTDAANLAINEA
jgi:hypothetical protein